MEKPRGPCFKKALVRDKVRGEGKGGKIGTYTPARIGKVKDDPAGKRLGEDQLFKKIKKKRSEKKRGG